MFGMAADVIEWIHGHVAGDGSWIAYSIPLATECIVYNLIHRVFMVASQSSFAIWARLLKLQPIKNVQLIYVASLAYKLES